MLIGTICVRSGCLCVRHYFIYQLSLSYNFIIFILSLNLFSFLPLLLFACPLFSCIVSPLYRVRQWVEEYVKSRGIKKFVAGEVAISNIIYTCPYFISFWPSYFHIYELTNLPFYLLTCYFTPPSSPMFPSHLLSILLRNSFLIFQIPAPTLDYLLTLTALPIHLLSVFFSYKWMLYVL